MVMPTTNSVVLPAPVVIKIDNEIIQSSNTGRMPSGAMVGDVVAEKKAVTVEWGVLQESEMAKTRKNLIAGFFPFVFNGGRGASFLITSYRDTVNEGHIGPLGDGIYWYKKATIKIIWQ